MRRSIQVVLSAAILLMVISGCSSESDNTVSDLMPDQDTYVKSQRELLGIWRLDIDIESQSTKVEFDRDLAAHFDVTELIPAPTITNESYDGNTNIYQADFIIQNTLGYDAFDVRMIVYSDDAGHELKNPDNWTSLYDMPGGAFINPFKAYAKTESSRRFANAAFHTETLNIYLPGGILYQNVVLGIEASIPSNCEEPYLIDNFTQDYLNSSVGSNANITVDVYDWQTDVDNVKLHCPVITGNPSDNFSFDSGNTWTLNLVNNTVAPIGDYLAMISAESAGSGNLVLCDICLISVSGSDGNLIWAKRAGGTGNDEGLAITALSDNSTVVTGFFNGSATFGQGETNQTVLNSVGGEDIFIARYNPDVTLAWAKRAGGSSNEKGAGITTLSDNSTVVSGYFQGSATFGPSETNQTILTSVGSNDIFIAKYNPDGTLAWAKRAGGTDSEIGFGITVLSDNSTVGSGVFKGSATFGLSELNQTVLTSAAGSVDIFIAQYNPDGTLAWAKRAGGVEIDECFGITTLSDNSTVVTGHFRVSATFGPGEPNQVILTSYGIYDIFIAQYNPDGTLAWAKRAGGLSDERGYGITTLSDNSTLVTGEFYGSATFGLGEPNQTVLTPDESSDIFIARYNPDGTLAWAKRAGGLNDERGYGITTLSDNSLVVTGNFMISATFGPDESKETILTSDGGTDIFIARFEP